MALGWAEGFCKGKKKKEKKKEKKRNLTLIWNLSPKIIVTVNVYFSLTNLSVWLPTKFMGDSSFSECSFEI